MMSLTDIANSYIEQGLSIIPIKIIPKNGKKEVILPDNWPNIGRTKTVSTWSSNIAILTGHGNRHNICVLDVDSPDHGSNKENGVNGLESIEKWQKEHGAFPDTRIAETPTGGRHYYFKVPQDTHIKKKAGILPGVDVQADRSCIIAPPTIYNGKRYRWINDAKIAEANKSVLELMNFKARTKKAELPQSSQDLNTIQEGGRTNYLVSMIGQQNFASNKASKESIKAMIRAENEMYCNPPLSEEELERQVFPAIDNLPPYEKKETDHPQKLTLMSSKELQDMYIPPLEWLVDDYLPLSGVVGLIGSPKSRKSFMALDLCLALAKGTKFLGKNTHKHDTLYFDLESGLRRPKERQEMILARQEAPDNFYIITSDQDVKQIDNGFIEQLTDILEKNRNIQFIVIDTLGILRGAKKLDYTIDVDDVKKLKDVCTKFNVCIMVVHHFNKARGSDKNGDIFDKISGTNGIFETLDTAWLVDIERGSTIAQFHITGRDIQEYNVVIDFNEQTMKWEYRGTWAEMEEARAQNTYENDPVTLTIKHILEKHPEGWTGTPQDIKDQSIELPKSINVTNAVLGRTISQYKVRLAKDGVDIKKEKRRSNNYYIISSTSSVTSTSSITSTDDMDSV